MARRPRLDAAPVVLDVTLAQEFLDHLKAKGDSKEWRRNARQHLAWWERPKNYVDEKGRKKPGAGIGGRDLRAGRRDSITIMDLRTALAGGKSARQREAVLRALYSFLRGADRITTEEDPTYGKPRIAPPGRPAQERIDKSISGEAFEKVRKWLDADWLKGGKNGRRWSDLIAVLDGTGMHVSELRRFAENGAIEALPGGRKPTKDERAVLAVPLHKRGAPWKAIVSEATAEAAKRLRADGSFSVAVSYAVLRDAARKEHANAKVLPGRFRHTVAKGALEAGATIGEIATFLGHKSPATTKKFYATLGVPMKIPARR